jgi:hypothetical protein
MTTDATEPTEQPIPYAPEEEPEPAKEPAEEPAPRMEARDVPPAQTGGIPAWAVVPPGLVFPRHRLAVFMRIPSSWTYAPAVGIPLKVETALDIAEAGGVAGGLWRQIVVWPLSIGDQKLALGRAMADPNRFPQELTKQMVRAVDGEVVDWSGAGGAANLDTLWEQLGGPGQNLLNRIWSQLHVLQKDRLTRFFENYIAVRV